MSIASNTAKGAVALALMGGGGVAASKYGGLWFDGDDFHAAHRQSHQVREWWNDMVVNKVDYSKDGGLSKFELKPEACSKGFFDGLSSFDKVGKYSKDPSNGEPYGCLTMSAWNDPLSQSSRFAAKIETVFIHNDKGLITTTLLVPHSSFQNFIRETYLRHELEYDRKEGKWKLIRGVRTFMSKPSARKIIFSGEGWFGKDKKWEIDVSKVCSRKGTLDRNKKVADKNICEGLYGEEDIFQDFKYVVRKIPQNKELGRWSSPFYDYRINYAVGNSNKVEPLAMWTNGDFNSQCTVISHEIGNEGWKRVGWRKQVWIDRTADYFSDNKGRKQACVSITKK